MGLGRDVWLRTYPRAIRIIQRKQILAFLNKPTSPEFWRPNEFKSSRKPHCQASETVGSRSPFIKPAFPPRKLYCGVLKSMQDSSGVCADRRFVPERPLLSFPVAGRLLTAGCHRIYENSTSRGFLRCFDHISIARVHAMAKLVQEEDVLQKLPLISERTSWWW